MFTGIIEEVGAIHQVIEEEGAYQYHVHSSASFTDGVRAGDSIAVNGVCLTACKVHEGSFIVDVSRETRQCSTFGGGLRNNHVNLERAVTPATRLGGHLVSGHVDGLGTLAERRDDESETVLWIAAPPDLSRYIAVKGSICIDGVSLTVNRIERYRHSVTLIPHTLESTTLRSLQRGDAVNIEVDLIARYLEQLTRSGSANS